MDVLYKLTDLDDREETNAAGRQENVHITHGEAECLYIRRPSIVVARLSGV
jgi:mannitol/fructose-specific phosphotransferase system IIA component (Ntr-type)